jgi:hypothetical protein
MIADPGVPVGIRNTEREAHDHGKGRCECLDSLWNHSFWLIDRQVKWGSGV